MHDGIYLRFVETLDMVGRCSIRHDFEFIIFGNFRTHHVLEVPQRKFIRVALKLIFDVSIDQLYDVSIPSAVYFSQL
jgi:hypothetical protein